MNITKLFHQILKPALGCTEPVAVALASSAAFHAAFGWRPDLGCDVITPQVLDAPRISVRVSRSVFKNGFAVAIPNSRGHKGLAISAALGVFCDPKKSLRVFEDLIPMHVQIAEEWVRDNCVAIAVADVPPSDVYIQAEVRVGSKTGMCTIRGEHSNIASLCSNGEEVYCLEPTMAANSNQDFTSELKTLSFDQLLAMVEALPDAAFQLIRDTVEMNIAACDAALEHPMGIGTGFFGATAKLNQAQQMASMTAAGSDARMSGHPVHIMTSAGSGNQGVMATIPIVIYGRSEAVEETRMLKGVALAHLVTMYVTMHVGYLSAFCGVAIKAGIGTACGLTYVMGGGLTEIGLAVKMMAATVTGMICDGAKAGCALKVGGTSDMAVRAATLAMNHAEVPYDNGIVGRTPEETVRHLAELGASMEPVDRKIVEIMLSKQGSELLAESTGAKNSHSE